MPSSKPALISVGAVQSLVGRWHNCDDKGAPACNEHVRFCMTHRSAVWDRRGRDMGCTGDFRAHSLPVYLPMVGMLLQWLMLMKEEDGELDLQRAR